MYAHHLHHSDIAGEMHCAPLYRCIDDAEQYIGSKGISNDMMIIAYDDFKGPNATGVYSFFESYGHKNIKILNGGRAAIMAIDPAQKVYDAINKELKAEKKIDKKARRALKKKADLSAEKIAELEAIRKASKVKQKEIKARLNEAAKDLLVVKGEEKVTPKTYHIDKHNINFDYIAEKNEVKKAVDDILKNGDKSQFAVIDTRAMSEIIGERKMDNCARSGHIPGSKFIEWNKISDTKNKKSFKSADEIQKVFDHYGVSKDKTIYAYCMVGTGRSSEIVTALRLLGYKDVKVFTGSWDVWGNDMNLPLKR